MRHADRDELIPGLLPAFRGIPYKVRGDWNSPRDLADVIEAAEGRAVTLKASELRAIAERIRDMQIALEQATSVNIPRDANVDAALARLEAKLAQDMQIASEAVSGAS